MRFALKARETVRIISKMIRQEFQRNITFKSHIVSTKDNTHAAFTQA